jgi:hypothetical protein
MTLFDVQFDNRPGLTRRDVIHEAIQVANIADLVRTSSFIHHWQHAQSIELTRGPPELVNQFRL